MNFKATYIVICFLSLIFFEQTVAYSAVLLPFVPGQSSTNHEQPTTLVKISLPHATFQEASPSVIWEQNMKSVWQRVFRRSGKKRVRTLEKEDLSPVKERKEPEQLWRVMFYNSEYMPERVARILAKVIPTLNRRVAFELCCQARMVGKVPVLITNKKEAELYCVALQRRGLTATVEPHSDVKR